MKISDFRALVEQRRSIRGYDESKAVPRELITEILDCARWAPSGGNGQPWEFIVVTDRETRHKIADYYMKQLEQKREMDLAGKGRIAFYYRFGQCHPFDSPGGDLPRPGFPVCQRRQFAVYGNHAEGVVEDS